MCEVSIKTVSLDWRDHIQLYFGFSAKFTIGLYSAAVERFAVIQFAVFKGIHCTTHYAKHIPDLIVYGHLFSSARSQEAPGMMVRCKKC